jgi:hypothetical protein
MEQHCIEVVVTHMDGIKTYQYFLSSAQVADFMKNVRFAWGQSVEAFASKQKEELITHLGEELKVS